MSTDLRFTIVIDVSSAATLDPDMVHDELRDYLENRLGDFEVEIENEEAEEAEYATCTIDTIRDIDYIIP